MTTVMDFNEVSFVTTDGVAACSNQLTAVTGVGLAVGGVVVTGVGGQQYHSRFQELEIYKI